MDVVDILVIGAGPVGGFFARKMCEKGCSVIMVEEHLEIGKPFQCAGLINPSAMEAVDLQNTVLSRIDGALMHAPLSTSIRIGEEGRVKTYAVCRKLFDQAVVVQSQRAGARLWLDCKPIDAVLRDDHVIVTLARGGLRRDVKAKLLIGADGAQSWVRRKFKMGQPKEMMIGYQVEVTGFDGPNNWLEMFTGQDVAPGFFAWAIPNGATHRIGMWCRARDLNGRSCEQLVEQLMLHSRWKERFAECRETARFCGPIPAGIVRRPVKERVMLIGDAVGSAKPSTGGGIGPAFQHVAEIVDPLASAVQTNLLSERRLKRIAKPVEKMRKDFERIRALRDFFVTTRSDEELEHIFEIFARPEVLALINEKGDIERPYSLGMTMLRHVPEFRGMALKAGFAVLFN